MRSAQRWAWTFATVLAATGLTGCGVAELQVTESSAGLPEQEDSAAFLDRMSTSVNVSENDAMRGIILAMDGKDDADTFGRRVDILADRQVVNSRWTFDADRPITRGRLAYMVYQACKMPGGVILTVTGPSQRYCLRELQYRKMMTRGSLFSPATGMEFVGVLTRADAYMRTGQAPDMAGNAPVAEKE